MIFLSAHVYYMYNRHICSQHKHFHYCSKYISRAPESVSMCQILLASRPIPRLPSDPHSIKQPEISLCVRVFLIFSSALPSSESSKFKHLSHNRREFLCIMIINVGRCKNIIPLATKNASSLFI